MNEETVKESVEKLNLNTETPATWGEDELMQLAQELRKKSKPMVIAANKIDIKGAMDNVKRIKKRLWKSPYL